MTSSLEKLKACTSVVELTTALHLLCAPFGVISSLRIVEVAKRGQRQMLCFLRFESPDAKQRFSTEFRVGSFGGELILNVDLHPAATQRVAAEKSISLPRSNSCPPELRSKQPTSK